MKLTQNILVPTDFSASSLLAMGAARILASQNDAKITLVHVMDPTPLTIGAPGLGSMTEAEIEPEVEARVHAELTRVREEQLGDVDSVKTALVISRNAADGIVHYADKEGVDMIVMADVLEHIGDLPRALAEVARVLKPGGTRSATVESAAKRPPL